jgi:predicted small secreted protein
MRKTVMAVAAVSCLSLGIAGCTTTEGALGGVATNSVGGAIVGAGIGALAGAVLVKHYNDGWCSYRYHGKLYRDRCR